MVCRSLQIIIWTFVLQGLVQAGVEAANLDLLSAQSQAKRLYERLTGLPPSASTLRDLVTLLQDGKADLAALRAIDDSSNYGFYKFVLRNLFNPLTNRASQSDLELNDFIATVTGLVKNNQSFDRALYADVIYTADDSLVAGGTPGMENLIRVDDNTPAAGMVRGLLRRSNADVNYEDNRHYSDLQKFSDWPARLVEKTQSAVYAQTTNGRVSAEDISGLLTTRQWASEFYIAGTNRRSFRFLMKGFVCRDMEDLMDISQPDTRVHQDVDRAPGGDHQTYLTRCVGCHSGMDGFVGAFAYLDFNQSQITYSQTLRSNNKQFRQSNVFPAGYRISDNSWVNMWTTGSNSILGWRTPRGGMSQQVMGDRGVKALGMVVASTEAFSECMVQRVYQRVCAKTPTTTERATLKNISREFETGFSAYQNSSAANPYNMRGLFARVSNMCFGH